MSPKTHTNFLAAFEPNQVYESLTEGHITSDVFHAGDLVLPSGRIIACDPGWLWCKDVDPFSRTVPPGRYPVLLSIEIEVTSFLEKSIEHRDLERLEMAIRLSVNRPNWVQLSDDFLNDKPSNPDCILVLEGQGRPPWSVNLEPGGRFSGCPMMMVSEWIEEDRWYREYWFNEPLQANAVLKITLNSEVYPLQPVTTNA
ncbi:DUF4241 domain-containing protein [Microcoleus sp.]|uniref:DUF4241 domain-containing protein n=1 Tax=Microcoleus sp. TaxID=44472 RepID=UPI0035252922